MKQKKRGRVVMVAILQWQRVKVEEVLALPERLGSGRGGGRRMVLIQAGPQAPFQVTKIGFPPCARLNSGDDG